MGLVTNALYKVRFNAIYTLLCKVKLNEYDRNNKKREH